MSILGLLFLLLTIPRNIAISVYQIGSKSYSQCVVACSFSGRQLATKQQVLDYLPGAVGGDVWTPVAGDNDWLQIGGGGWPFGLLHTEIAGGVYGKPAWGTQVVSHTFKQTFYCAEVGGVAGADGCEPCYNDQACTDVKWAVLKNNLYWALASPCSECMVIDPIPWGWRRPTDEEFASGYPSLAEFENGALCAAHIFDPTSQKQCDYCWQPPHICAMINHQRGYASRSYYKTSRGSLLVHDAGCDPNGNPIPYAVAVPGNKLFNYDHDYSNNPYPSSATMVTYTISSSMIYGIAGLLILILMVNCYYMYSKRKTKGPIIYDSEA